jgi:hypothetical protein
VATPIDHARNIGAVSAALLRQAGVPTVEALESLGWEQALRLCVEVSPGAANANLARALAGALEGRDWRDLPAPTVARARALAGALRQPRGCRRARGGA